MMIRGRQVFELLLREVDGLVESTAEADFEIGSQREWLSWKAGIVSGIRAVMRLGEEEEKDAGRMNPAPTEDKRDGSADNAGIVPTADKARAAAEHALALDFVRIHRKWKQLPIEPHDAESARAWHQLTDWPAENWDLWKLIKDQE